jgi:hypothetical protein
MDAGLSKYQIGSVIGAVIHGIVMVICWWPFIALLNKAELQPNFNLVLGLLFFLISPIFYWFFLRRRLQKQQIVLRALLFIGLIGLWLFVSCM